MIMRFEMVTMIIILGIKHMTEDGPINMEAKKQNGFPVEQHLFHPEVADGLFQEYFLLVMILCHGYTMISMTVLFIHILL